jgi:hypothetical protein
MPFSESVAEKALLDCSRCCCICHKFCGFKIELHHIIQKAEGGLDDYDNCIPLCFDCHAEVKAYNPKHPKGRKYTNSELRQHRNRWYEKVKNENLVVVHPDYIELDRKLFLKIKEILPTTGGAISFIRNHMYNYPFAVEKHNDLQEYILQCVNPDFEFIDADLEMRRIQLTNAINDFLDILGRVTFVSRRPSHNFLQAVYPDIQYEKPQVFYEAVFQIEEAKNKVCSAYDDLIRLGRRKLAV